MREVMRNVLGLFTLVALRSHLVSAHGIIARVAIDGTVYEGPPAGSGGASPASIVRQVSDNGPVKPTAADMGCGLGVHSPASMVAPANPGSKIAFQWMNGNGPWIHKLGPLLTYMAECTGTTCDQFDSSQAKWFKIDQVGQHSDETWFQADINQGKSLTVTLPSSLAAGDYLVRHEIIAMHNAVSAGGAEFYPSCIQVRLSAPSGQTTTPDNIVSFPGAYDNNLSDDSLVAPDIYNSAYQYPAFPGPALSNVADTTGGTITPELAAGGDTSSPASGTPASPTSSTITQTDSTPTDSSVPTDTVIYTNFPNPTSYSQSTKTVTATITVIGSVCAPASATGKKRMVRAHRRQH